ncbi:unnamed protein product [Prunus armeniaca]|uniref:Uncharacterized protein n=1 Tax=Prunus armeniaca TaxID=36596 RepID=A0A6J5WP33_PRUAR|nr:unnamed protein product [Prunus armeniaca]
MALATYPIYIGMNVINLHSSNVVIMQHFIHNQHFFFVNFAAQPTTLFEASTTSKRHHGKNNTILAFTIPTILTLVQMRYAQEDLFRTHRIIMMVVCSSVLAYCLAFSLLGLLLLLMKLSVISDEHDQSHAYIYKWCHVTVMLFGSISVASLLWLLLFPHSSSSRLEIYLILSLLVLLGLASKLVPAVAKFLSPVGRGQNHVRRASPLLPLNTVDLSLR